jgi:uncharacterized protein (DUF58 family)
VIDPEFLTQLDRFEVALDRMANSVYQGRQRSPELGEGQTFSDHRQYTPGDDIRLIDWRLLARTGELYIKRFEAERELAVHILLDASASMDFGDLTAGEHKFEFGAKLGLGLAYLAAETHNEFRVATFQDDSTRLDRGIHTRGEILRLIDKLNNITPTGPSDFRAAMRAYARTIESRALVVVISDFLTDPEEIATGLKTFGQHNVTTARVIAPDERDLPAEGDTVFEDLEDGRSIRTYFGRSLKRSYRERFEAHLDAVNAQCQRLGVPHIQSDTDSRFLDAFTDLWLTQQREYMSRL